MAFSSDCLAVCRTSLADSCASSSALSAAGTGATTGSPLDDLFLLIGLDDLARRRDLLCDDFLALSFVSASRTPDFPSLVFRANGLAERIRLTLITFVFGTAVLVVSVATSSFLFFEGCFFFCRKLDDVDRDIDMDFQVFFF